MYHEGVSPKGYLCLFNMTLTYQWKVVGKELYVVSA